MDQQARKRSGSDKGHKRTLVVDDHPIVRHALMQLLSTEESIEICGEADNTATAIEMVTTLKPDLVTLDLSLHGHIIGAEILTAMAQAHPGVKVLVITMLDETIYAENAMQWGAAGFVEKERATEQLLGAVRDVLAGRMFVPAATRDRLLMRATFSQRDRICDPVEKLSPREKQVFDLIGTGQSTEQMALTLGLSSKTIHTHRQHIMDKLIVSSSSQLVVHAAAWASQHPKQPDPANADTTHPVDSKS